MVEKGRGMGKESNEEMVAEENVVVRDVSG